MNAKELIAKANQNEEKAEAKAEAFSVNNEIIDALICGERYVRDFKIGSLEVSIQSETPADTYIVENLLAEIIGDREVSQREYILHKKDVRVALYLIKYGEKSFARENTKELLLDKYHFVGKLPSLYLAEKIEEEIDRMNKDIKDAINPEALKNS